MHRANGSGDPGPGSALELGILGPLHVRRDGAPIDVTGPKRRALLTLLGVHAGTAVSRDQLVDALWPQPSTGREAATLRVHISHLRGLLEPDRLRAPQVIVTVGSGYRLDADLVEVDLRRFEQLLGEAREARGVVPETAVELLNEALGLWRGRALQDVEHEEFAQDAIRRLEGARVQAIEERAAALLALGQDAAAIEDLEPLIHTDGTRERPVRLLMTALYRVGRHADALRAARRHVRVLAEEGLEPSPRIGELERRILQHDPTLVPEGAPSPGTITAGRSVRGYELRQEVGSGSIGVVFRAFQPSVGREVAIKAVHPQLAQEATFVRRFAEEARTVAGLEHPHIVPLYDFWRDPGGAFLVMRWMDGGSLADRCDGHWDDVELGRVFVQLADALGYAHSARVVHRELTPSNVLFDGAGNAYLSDLGLAAADLDSGLDQPTARRALLAHDASTARRAEGPSVSADVRELGALLAQLVSGVSGRRIGGLAEVARVATAPDAAERYPDLAAFLTALREAVGTPMMPVSRRVRRNPFKGLAPFTEGDRVDFHGRDDVIESLVGAVGRHGLTAVIGASGSGKSSVVMAGLVPELRAGVLPGSATWSIARMVPDTDPFEGFRVGLLAAAVGHPGATQVDETGELRGALEAALDGPSSRMLLVIDQFEELFASGVEERTRGRFLDELVDLVMDPVGRVRVVVTLRADLSDRALARPRLGELMTRSSVLLGPMLPEQVEQVIRVPAAGVGVQVEPGLVARIVRDVASAPAYLPLLQYVLSELFERRTEDRLTVQAYLALGGVQGVLERQAEATFAALGEGGQRAARQLFLRMVHLGDDGEEIRRRLPLTELRGLGSRAEVDAALEAFSEARLLAYDRDPVTRTPTVEVAHETVIERWARYRTWIDEARADLHAHRRLASAAAAWADADEDPAYLLTGGPLATASEVATGERVSLNASEARYLDESVRADELARERDVDRRRQQAVLADRARRRLLGGVAVAAVALVIALFATLAVVERQRADELAATQERQNVARQLAAAAVANLASGDPELSLLLALEAADLSLAAGEDILPEVVDGLHRAVITPRPSLEITGVGTAVGGRLLAFSEDGAVLALLASDGGAVVRGTDDGRELGRIAALEASAFGVDLHADGQRLLTMHPDGVRQWVWATGELEVEVPSPDGVTFTTAAYTRDGSRIATGGDDGVVRVWQGGQLAAELVHDGHIGAVASLDFDPSGSRLVSVGPVEPSDPGPRSWAALVWDVDSATVTARTRADTIVLPITDVAWHPTHDVAIVATAQGETFLFDTVTGERLNSFGNGQHLSNAVAFDPSGVFVVAAGFDGVARAYGTWVGGEAGLVLPTGGAPLRDARFAPSSAMPVVATIGVDGTVRLWRDLSRSELPARITDGIYPQIAATPDGDRYLLSATFSRLMLDGGPGMEVIDAATLEPIVQRAAVPWGGERRPAISRDGSLVAFAGASGDVEITQVATGATRPIVASALWSASLDFSPDSTLLAGAGIDGSISVWDVATQRLVTRLDGHGDREPAARSAPTDAPEGVGPALLQLSAATIFRVDEVRFHPDGGELASAGFDGTVRVWDPVAGRGRVLHTFDHEVFSLTYSPDGAWIAASDRIGTVRVLDRVTGEVVQTLEPVSGRSELAFSPDGRLIAGAGPGPVAHLWDVATGRIVRRFHGAIYEPKSVAFVNGGGELRIAGGDGTDRGYVLDPLRLVEIARARLSRTFTHTECLQYLGRACDG